MRPFATLLLALAALALVGCATPDYVAGDVFLTNDAMQGAHNGWSEWYAHDGQVQDRDHHDDRP